MPKEPGKDLG